jgi:hypothetical protein
MRAVLLSVAIAFAAGCGGPVLQNVPAPNKAVAAGVVAGAAAAVTIADPNGAARKQEQKKEYDAEKKPVKNDTSVPADVLDRLDDKKKKAKPTPDAATESEAEPAPSNPALDFGRPPPP